VGADDRYRSNNLGALVVTDPLDSISDLIAALNRIDDTLRQVSGLEQVPGQRSIVQVQDTRPVMPKLTANQWPFRNGDGFPTS
jgi:hypothetical protein